MMSYCLCCGNETDGGGVCSSCMNKPETKPELPAIKSINYMYEDKRLVVKINLDEE